MGESGLYLGELAAQGPQLHGVSQPTWTHPSSLIRILILLTFGEGTGCNMVRNSV